MKLSTFDDCVRIDPKASLLSYFDASDARTSGVTSILAWLITQDEESNTIEVSTNILWTIQRLVDEVEQLNSAILDRLRESGAMDVVKQHGKKGEAA